MAIFQFVCRRSLSPLDYAPRPERFNPRFLRETERTSRLRRFDAIFPYDRTLIPMLDEGDAQCSSVTNDTFVFHRVYVSDERLVDRSSGSLSCRFFLNSKSLCYRSAVLQFEEKK